MDMHFLSGSALMKVVIVIATISAVFPALAGGEMYMAAPKIGTGQPVMKECPPGTTQYRDGTGGPTRCVAKPPCALGQSRDALGDCHCPPGTTEVRSGSGLAAQCIAKPSCAPGQSRDARGNCHCPPGVTEVRNGSGVPAKCITRQ